MFTLERLPFAMNSLEPYMSEETLKYHYGKHHKAYVDKLNELLIEKHNEKMTLEEIIVNSEEGPVFNNAAQIWNHNFFWQCLSPENQKPHGRVLELIIQKWGTFEKFQEDFKKHALENFGSGWTWLVLNHNKIEIQNTPDAMNPVKKGWQALLTIDIWEHAYYIDHKNARPAFIDSFWKIVNWNFVNEQLD